MSEDSPKYKTPTVESFEVGDITIRDMLKVLAGLVDQSIPDEWGFSIFLYQLHDEQENTNVFYVSSLASADVVPLIKKWIERQTQ
jgi:hypothetical protein